MSLTPHQYTTSWVRRLRAFTALVLLALMPWSAAQARQLRQYGAGPALHPNVTLSIPGNSRFAAALSGRDTVQGHLLAMGIHWEQLRKTLPAFVLGAHEAAWVVPLPLGDAGEHGPALLAVVHDANGDATALELFVHNEERFAKRVPRDDGVQRTSLAAKRNLQQVQALHGTGGSTRFLAASRARVMAILQVASASGPSQLVQYRFDPSGRITSLRTVLPLGVLCCNSSGSNETFAFMITPP
ncbi:hypothetical protein [Gemmatimonas phototrophica]|uniref:Uncharacterized protein n=1 Tax=Gemmatimonas phototrophica TaxID=1379270 RepID=A0A143BJE4_9BACT|nr:hypothetical protein [Gemmatimonas phototrophica]AMW04713.1 hypothetical protein GEMMAAP_07400 [Gemmatimonas phototrophica]